MKFVTSLVVLMLVVVVSLNWPFKTYTWNQKLTVSVATPDGERSGASVVRIEALFGRRPLSANEVQYDIRGEAAVVDLGSGRYLFALIRGTAELAARTWRGDIPRSRKEWLPVIERLRDRRDVPFQSYPRLVTFDDINVPASVRRVDPNDLAATFGPGYALRSLTIEITDEPVTEGRVEQIIDWLGDDPESRLGPATGRTTGIPFYRRVSNGDFIRR
ncbi:MAG: hypothetical protein AAF732_22920 [Pseudomonadota bacterium]